MSKRDSLFENVSKANDTITITEKSKKSKKKREHGASNTVKHPFPKGFNGIFEHSKTKKKQLFY